MAISTTSFAVPALSPLNATGLRIEDEVRLDVGVLGEAERGLGGEHEDRRAASAPSRRVSAVLTTSCWLPLGDIGTTSPPISSIRSSSSRMPAATICSSSATVNGRRGRPSAAVVVLGKRVVHGLRISHAALHIQRFTHECAAGRHALPRRPFPHLGQRAPMNVGGRVAEAAEHREVVLTGDIHGRRPARRPSRGDPHSRPSSRGAARIPVRR